MLQIYGTTVDSRTPMVKQLDIFSVNYRIARYDIEIYSDQTNFTRDPHRSPTGFERRRQSRPRHPRPARMHHHRAAYHAAIPHSRSTSAPMCRRAATPATKHRVPDRPPQPAPRPPGEETKDSRRCRRRPGFARPRPRAAVREGESSRGRPRGS